MPSIREQGIFVELEAVYGTAETLVGADALEVSNIQPNPAEDLRLLERDIIRSSLNPAKAIYAGSLFGFSFDVDLVGGGAPTAGTAPQALGDLLQACGMDETIVAVTSVTYTPSSDLATHGSVTIGYREGANYRVIAGCRGSVSIVATTGGFCKLTFNMKGKIDSETQTAAPTATFEAIDPEPFLNASFSIGTFAAPISQLTLDVANELALAPDPNDADGFGELRITSRKPQVSTDPEAEGISTKDWVALLRAGTSQAVVTGAIGATAGNKWALNIPLAYARGVGYGDREGLLTNTLEMGAEDTDGADDFSIQIT